MTTPPRWLLPVARALVGVVGATALVLSYGALHELALGARIDPSLAWLWPVSVDVLAVVSAIAARVFHGGRWSAAYAWSVLLAFLALSVWGNGLHAVADRAADETLTLDPWQAVVVSATPPVALALALHLMLMMGARLAPAEANHTPPHVPPQSPGPDGDDLYRAARDIMQRLGNGAPPSQRAALAAIRGAGHSGSDARLRELYAAVVATEWPAGGEPRDTDPR